MRGGDSPVACCLEGWADRGAQRRTIWQAFAGHRHMCIVDRTWMLIFLVASAPGVGDLSACVACDAPLRPTSGCQLARARALQSVAWVVRADGGAHFRTPCAIRIVYDFPLRRPDQGSIRTGLCDPEDLSLYSSDSQVAPGPEHCHRRLGLTTGFLRILLHVRLDLGHRGNTIE